MSPRGPLAGIEHLRRRYFRRPVPQCCRGPNHETGADFLPHISFRQELERLIPTHAGILSQLVGNTLVEVLGMTADLPVCSSSGNACWTKIVKPRKRNGAGLSLQKVATISTTVGTA